MQSVPRCDSVVIWVVWTTVVEVVEDVEVVDVVEVVVVVVCELAAGAITGTAASARALAAPRTACFAFMKVSLTDQR
jgi:hypothetical protein